MIHVAPLDNREPTAQLSLHSLKFNTTIILTSRFSSQIPLAIMVVVAVAGGSGHVGRTIVETLVEIGDHEVIVLGRKV